MENASKFLLMAGGILLGIITISIFYFMFGQLSEYQNASQVDYTQEELMAFNQGFESYNKKLMYGSEVLSVINKAVDNNTRYGIVNEPTNEYYINIGVRLSQPLYIRIDTYKRERNGEYSKEGTRTKTIFKAGSTNTSLQSFQISNKEQYQDLCKYLIDGATMTDENGNDVVQSKKAVKGNEYRRDGEIYYDMIYYPVTEFKRLTFRCSNVEYNNANGRIRYMEFIQYQ